MTGPDAPEPAMPNVFRLHADAPGFPGEALDALIAGKPLTAMAAAGPAASPGLQRVAELLSALTAPPAPDELAGHTLALAEFRSLGGRLGTPSPAAPAPAPRGRLRRVLSSRLAAAIAGAAVTLGGLAVAAYTGLLPAPVQQWAHETIHAPAPVSSQPAAPPDTPHRHATPPSPAATPGTHAASPSGSASPTAPPTAPAGIALPRAARLCRAWDLATPRARMRRPRFQKLIAAAGGVADVPAYCAAVTAPPSP
jgi:hypothetical protein